MSYLSQNFVRIFLICVIFSRPQNLLSDDTEIRIERMLTRGLISFEQAQFEKEKYLKLYPRRAQKAKRGIASLNGDSFAIPTIQETQKVLLNSKN